MVTDAETKKMISHAVEVLSKMDEDDQDHYIALIKAILLDKKVRTKLT